MLSIQFSQEEKDGMIKVLENHGADELLATVRTPGETVLTETEALMLAGLVRPYYHFLADRLTNHPAIGDGKLPTIEGLQAEVKRLRAEDEIWDKTSLVEIVTERDELQAEVERLREQRKALKQGLAAQKGITVDRLTEIEGLQEKIRTARSALEILERYAQTCREMLD